MHCHELTWHVAVFLSFQTTIQSVLQRIDEVRTLCLQRRVLLVDTIAKNNRLSAIIVPPEPKTPPPRAPKIGRGRRRKSLSSAGSPANGHSRVNSHNYRYQLTAWCGFIDAVCYNYIDSCQGK